MSLALPSLGTENQSPYQVESRREILALLKGFRDKSQLISLMINNGSEAFITSVLDIDDANNTVIIDSAPGNEANQRIVEASSVFFDGLLDRISIQFSSSKLQRTQFEGRPALQMPVPTSVIRLQRRENYRINTPVSMPIKCVIPIETESGKQNQKFSLVDISCGGIAILDDRNLIDITIGTCYEFCQIDIPNIGLIDLTLQIRNSQELTLLNGKTTRRIGCAFVNLSSRTLTSVQRYIMKLERERNAKMTGM
ncbi:flagellar brake protein [Undibacterium macrobrachii]|jgi:c-di-GMP-binding flagellar brake protein YcgR|uniref:Flagellar brake protein YcgR n=1 Tax=Undibacterium macrobrachii TaxID=1119058 RepID=A0ABQ2XJ19_9BURK|nr:flagellar brake protein [Undibacterium macrobrachii]GGX19437.1 flagellar brake protein YcgR [Undibacterium macrobrachii]